MGENAAILRLAPGCKAVETLPIQASRRHPMTALPYPTAVYLSAPDMVRLVQRKGLSVCIAARGQDR